jgi:arylsulfatase
MTQARSGGAVRAGWALVTAALVLAVAPLALTGCRLPDVPPHVVLITVDTLRADHVGAYGNPHNTTPGIDRFFRRGTTYLDAVASAPCTVPSVRQMLAGGFDLDPDRPTLAEILQRRNYQTAAVVSQHQFHGHTGRDYARGFDHFDLQLEAEVDRHGLSTRTADQVSDRALAWLAERDRKRPFFLWLHYFDPHDPYQAPAEHRIFGGGNPSRRSGDRRSDLMNERRSPNEPWNQAGYIYDDADVAHLRDLYDAEIRFVDTEVRRVLAFLVKEELVERSVVAFTADHGEWLGENGWWDHCATLRDEEVHVPLMIRNRGVALAGIERESGPVSTLDLLPTLVAAAGIPLPDADYHGVDLAERRTGRAVLAFWQQLALARDAAWKLYLDGGEPLLEPVDPAAAVAEDAATAVASRQRLRSALDRRRPLRRRVFEESQQSLAELQAIGYVE